MTSQLGTDINTDQILAQMRQGQANSQLPSEVTQQGVIVQPGTTAPFMLLDLYSPTGAYDSIFLANYATINLQYALTRLPGVGQVQIFGAGPYAMRIWVNPDKLASLGVTVSDITNAVKAQNKVNPAGQVGGEPVPPGQQFTYNVRAPGRLPTAEEFDEIVVRAQSDGSILRLKDVARVELGSQYYSFVARLGVSGEKKPSQPAALIALYLTPGSNALQTRAAVLKMMDEAKGQVPPGAGLHYRARHDTRCQRRHPRNLQDTRRGPAPGHHRRLHFPAGLQGHADSAARRSCLSGRDLHGLSHAWLLHQYPVAFGYGPGDWTGRR